MGIVMDGEKNIPVRYKYLKVNSSTRRRSQTDESPSTLGAGSNISTPVRDEYNDGMDNDYYLLAKSYFDCREYRRAAHVLRDQTGKRAIFLRCYSLYLVCFESHYSFKYDGICLLIFVNLCLIWYIPRPKMYDPLTFSCTLGKWYF